MNVAKYLQKKQKKTNTMPLRERCQNCLQPSSWCYCKKITPFDCGIKFVILIHPLERRRRIASGRMSHLMLEDSEIIHGHTYSTDERVNQLITDPNYFPVILYLDRKATKIDMLSKDEKNKFCPAKRKLLIFVVDGTWGTASKTVRKSSNLAKLPRISFTPQKPSNFRVRRQPDPLCYSTIEAIHHTIQLFENSQGYNIESRKHDQLLRVFDDFISMQVLHVEKIKKKYGTLQYRKKKTLTGRSK